MASASCLKASPLALASVTVTSPDKSQSTVYGLVRQPGHLWLKDGMTKEPLQKIEEFYRNRYGEQGDKK